MCVEERVAGLFVCRPFVLPPVLLTRKARQSIELLYNALNMH